MEIKRKLSLCLLFWVFVFIPCQGSAHTYRCPVIVDTDMALDDIRAITLLLNSHFADIRLMVVSEGIASPKAGKENLERLLSCLNRPPIPIAAGEVLDKPALPARALSENLNWPATCQPPASPVADQDPEQAILNALGDGDPDVIYICLGPMTNLARAIKEHPEIKRKIARIIYFGDHPESADPGWNTLRDQAAAREVFESGIEIHAVHPRTSDLQPFDRQMISRIETAATPSSTLMITLHATPEIEKAMDQRHLMIWDENAVLYLENPHLFRMAPVPEKSHLMRLRDFDEQGVMEAYVSSLRHPADVHLDARKAVILKAFPYDAAAFKPDVAKAVRKIISRYGMEEWKAAVLTNEFHRHLGIYSLVGAKMGIRARELLEAPFDQLSVISHAGQKPPLSCLNDGLQVSTGATLGRGNIRIDGKEIRPAATFKYHNRAFLLTLKPFWQKKITSDIRGALKKHGGLTADYFAHIRKLSISYWHDFDRKEIFDEKPLHDGE